jgi:hypothetical protein
MDSFGMSINHPWMAHREVFHDSFLTLITASIPEDSSLGCIPVQQILGASNDRQRTHVSMDELCLCYLAVLMFSILGNSGAVEAIVLVLQMMAWSQYSSCGDALLPKRLIGRNPLLKPPKPPNLLTVDLRTICAEKANVEYQHSPESRAPMERQS